MADTDEPGRTKHPDETPIDSDEMFQSRDDGQLHFTPESIGTTFPISAPTDATPLEEGEPEGTIPPSPLWAMKERRHEQWLHLFGHPSRIRQCIGQGDAAVYVIDDGKHHCMIGRRVGATLDNCVYSLVARVPLETYAALAGGSIDGKQAFLDGSEIGLSGTAEGTGVSNIMDIDYYDSSDEIPEEYLPPHAFIEFAQDLPTIDG